MPSHRLSLLVVALILALTTLLVPSAAHGQTELPPDAPMLRLSNPDTVYVVDRSALTAEQQTALPRTKAASANARVHLSSSEIQTLRAEDALLPVEEIGLRYQWKATEQSESGSNGSGFDNDISEGTTAYMGVDISGAPSGQLATRTEYSWQLDHDQITDLQVRLGTDSWNDGYVDVPKTGNNGYLAQHDEYSNESRASVVDNDQPVNQTWFLAVDDTDGFDGNVGHIDAVDLTVFYVVKDETSLSLSVSDASVPWNQDVTFTAELTTGGLFSSSGVNGKPIELQLDGQTIYMGDTGDDGDGIVKTTLAAPRTVASFPVTARFGGDAGYLASEDQVGFSTESHATRIQVDDATGTEGESVMLTARLTDDSAVDAGEGVGNRTLVFYQDGQWISGRIKLGEAVTDGSGTATFQYDSVRLKSGTGAQPQANTQQDPIIVAFEGDTRYDASQGEGTLTIIEQTPTSTALSATPDSGPWGRNLTLEADLGVSADGLPVDFYVDGTLVGTRDTNNGVATLTATAPDRVGDVRVEAVFSGDPPYEPSSEGMEITASRRATTVQVSDVQAREDEDATLKATLIDRSGTSDDGDGIGGRTLAFYQETTATADCDLNVSCAFIADGETDTGGTASVVYTGVEPDGPQAKADTDGLYVDFEGSTLYAPSTGEASLQIDDPAVKPPIIRETTLSPVVNQDGTIEVVATIDGQGRTVTSAEVTYRPDYGASSSETVELQKESDGTYRASIPKTGLLNLEYFSDGQEVEYWITAENENGTTSRLPTADGVRTVIAENGRTGAGPVVTHPAEDLVQVVIEDQTVVSRDEVETTIRLDNETFLNWGVRVERNGQRVGVADLAASASDDLATLVATVRQGGTLPNEDEWGDVYLRGNRYTPTFALDRQSVTFTVTTQPDDRLDVRLERLHWTTDIMSLLQILEGTLAQKMREHAKASPNGDAFLAYSQAKQRKIASVFYDALSKALLLRLSNDLANNAGALAESYPVLHDAFSGAESVPGRLKLLQSMAQYLRDLLLDPGFYESIKQQGGDALTETDAGQAVASIVRFLRVVGIATESVNLTRNVYEGLTLPYRDQVVFRHAPTLQVDAAVESPQTLALDAYPEGMRDRAKDWYTVRPGQSDGELVLTVKNTSGSTIDNVWLGMDLWTKSTLENGSVVAGAKVENTRTPIADPETGVVGALDFQAYRCATLSCTSPEPVPSDQTYTDPDDGTEYGQGVRMQPDDVILFRAPYSFETSATGHAFEADEYFLRYRLWHNGFPGSSTGQSVTNLRTRTLQLLDDVPPAPPEPGATHPYGLTAQASASGAVLTWFENDPNVEGDVVFYRIERKDAPGTSFSTVAWIPARTFQYVDDAVDPTAGSDVTYRLTAFDNAGRASTASDQAALAPLPAALTGTAQFVASNQTVSFTGTGVDIDFAGLTQGGLISVRFDENRTSSKASAKTCGTTNNPEECAAQSGYAWRMDDGGATFSDQTTIRFRLADVPTATGIERPEDVVIYHDAENDGTYTVVKPAGSGVDDNGTPRDPTDDVLIASGMTSLGTFLFAGDTAGPLPIELVRFEGRNAHNGIRLVWETASEDDNAAFLLERSASGSEPDDGWTSVATVEGNGTTDAPSQYAVLDEQVPYAADAVRYRLTQVDADGKTTRFDPITVRRSVPNQVELLPVYPNPARTRTTVRVGVPDDRSAALALYDVMGRRVQRLSLAQRPGRQELTLRTDRLAPGVYFLRLQAGSTVQTRRITVVQ